MIEGFDGGIGQPVAGGGEGFFAGEDFEPFDFALAVVGFGDGCIKNSHASAPNIGAGTVTFDIGHHRIVRHM